jgi:two-component system sensor histidine kinase KdpD
LLKNIGGQAKRLDKLVGKLLDLLRIEAGELRIDRDWTELGALVTDTVAKFERLNTPCQISQQIAEDLPLVYVDPEYMVQVLWNLLENARKYSPSTSRVSVSALAINGEVFLRVADRGPGIPVEEREKIFHNYYRLPREQQMRAPGSGLGLAICRGIIESHGGRIWVEERPGGGSVFCVALPPFLPIPVV